MPTDISARVRAKFPIDEAWIEVWEGSIHCSSCRRETTFVSSLRVLIGAQRCRLDLAELGEYGDLFETICEPLIPFITAYRIARRPSVARGRWCVSDRFPPHFLAGSGRYDFRLVVERRNERWTM